MCVCCVGWLSFVCAFVSVVVCVYLAGMVVVCVGASLYECCLAFTPVYLCSFDLMFV